MRTAKGERRQHSVSRVPSRECFDREEFGNRKYVDRRVSVEIDSEPGASMFSRVRTLEVGKVLISLHYRVYQNIEHN